MTIYVCNGCGDNYCSLIIWDLELPRDGCCVAGLPHAPDYCKWIKEGEDPLTCPDIERIIRRLDDEVMKDAGALEKSPDHRFIKGHRLGLLFAESVIREEAKRDDDGN